jgi:hypothetical protein
VTIRRQLISPKLPELRSGNAELDKWVQRHLAEHVANVADRIKFLTPEIGQFNPTTWEGFSTDPVGNVSYQDFGSHVSLWVDENLTGVSDEPFMAFTGLPLALRPSNDRFVRCLLLDESSLAGGVTRVDLTGEVTFFLEEVVVSPPDGIGFANNFTDPSAAGYKGLPGGWLIQYVK